jgi:hypothetical protein
MKRLADYELDGISRQKESLKEVIGQGENWKDEYK